MRRYIIACEKELRALESAAAAPAPLAFTPKPTPRLCERMPTRLNRTGSWPRSLLSRQLSSLRNVMSTPLVLFVSAGDGDPRYEEGRLLRASLASSPPRSRSRLSERDQSESASCLTSATSARKSPRCSPHSNTRWNCGRNLEMK